MRWPRWTTRKLMGWTVGLALVLGLGMPAVEVASHLDGHIHVYYTLRDRQLGSGTHEHFLAPFLPRYWQCLRGRPWREQPLCGRGWGRLGETCEYDRPDLVDGIGPNRQLTRPPIRIGAAGPLAEGDLVPENWTPPPSSFGR